MPSPGLLDALFINVEISSVHHGPPRGGKRAAAAAVAKRVAYVSTGAFLESDLHVFWITQGYAPWVAVPIARGVGGSGRDTRRARDAKGNTKGATRL